MSSLLGTASAVGDCCIRASSCSPRGALVCLLAWHWKDPLREELSGACQLSTLISRQSLGCQDWGWDLGESREGGSVCEYGDKSSGSRPEVPPGGCLSLPVRDKMALPTGKEAGRGEQDLPGASEACRVPGRLPSPASVLSTHCHPLPNVNSELALAMCAAPLPNKAVHGCLLLHGTVCPHPTTSGGSV